MRDALQTWVCERWGDSATVREVEDLGGHSGQTLGFKVAGGGLHLSLVVRIAPAGVAHRGSTDVLRQAPLLRVLREQGVRVPAVHTACDESRFFGAPFLVMERLPGRPLIMGPDTGAPWLPEADRQRAHEMAVEQLVRIHAVEVSSLLGTWDRPRSLREELDFWTDILQKSRDETWIDAGMKLRQRLLDQLPPRHQSGLCHGDFQTNNVLFAGSGDSLEVTGIVDWEIAGIGATELDLAWFLMMNDPVAWHPVEQRGGVDLNRLVDVYEREAGAGVANLGWFWALACFRFVAIAALNIRLHRTGRRPDEAWERAAMTVPLMYERGSALLM